jgi:hypothetical protein
MEFMGGQDVFLQIKNNAFSHICLFEMYGCRTVIQAHTATVQRIASIKAFQYLLLGHSRNRNWQRAFWIFNCPQSSEDYLMFLLCQLRFSLITTYPSVLMAIIFFVWD